MTEGTYRGNSRLHLPEVSSGISLICQRECIIYEFIDDYLFISCLINDEDMDLSVFTN